MSNGNGNNNGQQGGCGNGYQGRGCGNGGGRGNRGCGHGRGNGGHGSSGRGANQERGWSNNYIDPEWWNIMSWEEPQAIIEARNHARSANNAHVNGGQDNDLTIAGPPITINMANGVDGNNNNNCQANTTNQTNQGSVNPGTMIRNMMSSASACSANASNSACQDEITVIYTFLYPP